jgi:hypothetical protein
MSMYIVFFGKSQDFTSCFYDRTNPIRDFNVVLKDFDLLESKTFTVDDIKNKEILSRYYFRAHGKSYSLLKLYSFAQAYSGNRIAGSIYGVGLLSEDAIQLTIENLSLLRAAKDKFANLSLDGFKFNKSDFHEDSDRIWNAIVSNSNGNLLDKVKTANLKINNNGGQVAFYVNDLFSDAVKLNDRIDSQDYVYFSEDLEHLKRTQEKWGKEAFPIYWEQNNQFIIYKEPEIVHKHQVINGKSSKNISSVSSGEDVGKLKAMLSDCQYRNLHLEQDMENLSYRFKLLTYIIYGLSFFTLILLLYIAFFSGTEEKKEPLPIPPNIEYSKSSQRFDPISVFLEDIRSVDSGIVFLESIRFVYLFDAVRSFGDSLIFHSKFQHIQNVAENKQIMIDNIREVYLSKCSDLKTKH